MTFGFGGRVAIVTGAASGIGRRIALDLASRGATVVGADLDAAALGVVVEACRAHAPASRAAVLDVADRSGSEGLVRDTLTDLGTVDVLVNNAAVPLRRHATRLRPEDVERVLAANFLSAVYLTLAALPSMLERRDGRIVNVSSTAGRIGNPREAAYSASKFALAGWSEALAADLLGSGVRVHLLLPGPIDTPLWDKLEEPAAYRGRLHPPETVSAAVMDCLETGRFERWAPRRYRAVPILRALAPEAFLRRIAAFDRRGRARAGPR